MNFKRSDLQTATDNQIREVASLLQLGGSFRAYYAVPREGVLPLYETLSHMHDAFDGSDVSIPNLQAHAEEVQRAATRVHDLTERIMKFKDASSPTVDTSFLFNLRNGNVSGYETLIHKPHIANTLKVAALTTPVIMGSNNIKINFGQFLIPLSYRRIHIYSVDSPFLHYTSNHTHPHLSGDQPCFGEHTATVTNLRNNGSFLEMLILIRLLWSNYNGASPHHKFSKYLEYLNTCAICKQRITTTTAPKCPNCGRRFHKACYAKQPTCAICSSPLCTCTSQRAIKIFGTIALKTCQACSHNRCDHFIENGMAYSCVLGQTPTSTTCEDR